VAAVERKRLSIALLIDGENIAARYAEEILEITNILGECELRKVFGNVRKPAHREWTPVSETHGLTVIRTPPIAGRKNTADIALTVVAMELLLSVKDEYDGFVIASSDSDFTALLMRLREDGKFVATIGCKQTHHSLREACDMFLELESLKSKAKELKIAQEALPVLEDALLHLKADSTMQDKGTDMKVLHHFICEKSPDFTTPDGYIKFRELIKKIPEFQVSIVNDKDVLKIRNI